MAKEIRFTDELTQTAVAKVVDLKYVVREMAEQLGISTKFLNTWKTQFVKLPLVRTEVVEQATGIKRLKCSLTDNVLCAE